MQKRQPLPTMIVEVWLLKSWALKGCMWTQVPFKFFSSMNPFKKDHETQKVFFERCDVIYNQGIFTLRIIESIWLHRLAYKSCSQMIFPSLNFFVEKRLSTLVQKTLVEHVQLTLTTCLFVTCTFDL
jgi:hypothetical protein